MASLMPLRASAVEYLMPRAAWLISLVSDGKSAGALWEKPLNFEPSYGATTDDVHDCGCPLFEGRKCSMGEHVLAACRGCIISHPAQGRLMLYDPDTRRFSVIDIGQPGPKNRPF